MSKPVSKTHAAFLAQHSIEDLPWRLSETNATHIEVDFWEHTLILKGSKRVHMRNRYFPRAAKERSAQIDSTNAQTWFAQARAYHKALGGAE